MIISERLFKETIEFKTKKYIYNLQPLKQIAREIIKIDDK